MIKCTKMSKKRSPVIVGAGEAGKRGWGPCDQYISKRETGGDWAPDGRPRGPTLPHPRRPRPYYTTNRPAKPVLL